MTRTAKCDQAILSFMVYLHNFSPVQVILKFKKTKTTLEE